MKRLFCLFLTLTLLLCACAPDGRTDPTEDTGVETVLPTQTSPTTEPTEETLLQTDALDDLRNHLPIMDGSTSLIPLEAGIRAALYGKTIEEATLDVAHSSTWGAFRNLLHDRADLIFSVPLSQEQQDEAASMGITLETVPIAKEGFVFVVNAENPVDTLTQEQLRDIYSGKITNWSEVGGLDETIIPYQRNNDSGSQNYMITFMGDTPLMDAPTEMRPTSMSGLMDVVALNDNARGAIGYSVYAYAADMYGNGNEIKFIQVDGIAPSKATMASGDYPLLGENIAVFNANAPENGYVRQLVQWICSYDGQLALAQAGYVTLEDIGFDYTEMTLSKYQGVGTGAPATEADAYEDILVTVNTSWSNGYRGKSIPLDNGMITYQVPALTNTALQTEIQSFVDEQIQSWAWELAEETKQRITKHNETAPPANSYSVIYTWYFQAVQDGLPLYVGISCTNGYLSAAVTVGYGVESGPYDCYKRVETATWDLLTGQRLQPEDLFCRDVDVDEALNSHIRTQIQHMYDFMYEWHSADPLKQEFAGLPTTGWHLIHDGIFIDQGNPYFSHGAFFSLDAMPNGTLVCQQNRAFSQLLADENLSAIRQIRMIPVNSYYEFNRDGSLDCEYLPETQYPHAKTINDTVREHINTWYTKEKVLAFVDAQGYDPETVFLNWEYVSVYLTNWADRYVVFKGPDPTIDVDHLQLFYPHDSCLIFSLETGEQLRWDELLLPGWEQHCQLKTYAGEEPPEGLTADDLQFVAFLYPNDESTVWLNFFDPEGGESYRLKIPMEWLNL